MKKPIVPINENINIKHLPDRSDLAKLYYVPKNAADQSILRQVARVKTINIFTAAMGINLPFATIAAITSYMFTTPLERIPFIFIFSFFSHIYINRSILCELPKTR
jgi:hypothetical protein